ncbi:hypothetical protein G6F46_015480 [Rhizopus delemar]|nr:hypothetical protein G6F46_015480 [Rhizopus delemar]
MRGEGGNPKAQPSLAPQAPQAPQVPLIPQPLTEADLDEGVALEAHVQAFPWTRGNFADALAAGYGAWVLRREGKVAAPASPGPGWRAA